MFNKMLLRRIPSPETDHLMERRFLHFGLCSLLCGLAFLITLHARADSTNRGVWCWKTPSPYGLNYIIGTDALQNAAVQQFKLWGISHVYGSYGDQLKTTQGQAALAGWNTLLNNNGIESQLLISDYTLGAGDNNIILQMISFNQSQPAAAQVKGVHLDLEPWGQSSWGTDDKYNDLVNLASEYQQVRAELDASGQSNVLVYADMTDWLDSSPTINWPSSTVRDQWYSDILTNLAGITLMSYQKNTFSRIQSAVSWELANHPGVVRVGIDAGAGETWSDLGAFLTVAGQLESTYTDSAGIDIYDLITFEKIVPPVLGIGSAPPLTSSGFSLVVQGPIGSNCVVQASTDLANWQTVTNFLSASWLTYLTDPAATNSPYRFYQVTRP